MVLKELMERAKGIEPSYAAWEAAVLPLNYARETGTLCPQKRASLRVPLNLSVLLQDTKGKRLLARESHGQAYGARPSVSQINVNRRRNAPAGLKAPIPIV